MRLLCRAQALTVVGEDQKALREGSLLPVTPLNHRDLVQPQPGF